MNKKAARNSVILITLAFIAAIAFGILSRPQLDTQAVTQYLESMAPEAQAHSDWLRDYETLTGLYGMMSQSQKVEALNKLLGRMEEIQISVEESAPPEILKNIVTKWGNECRLILQAIFQLSLGLERNNIEWISQAYELLIEAEGTRQQWKDELLNLLNKNDLEIQETALNSYFS